jgi:hypothetical protein
MKKNKRISKDDKKLLEFLKLYQKKQNKVNDTIKQPYGCSNTEIKPKL